MQLHLVNMMMVYASTQVSRVSKSKKGERKEFRSQLVLASMLTKEQRDLPRPSALMWIWANLLPDLNPLPLLALNTMQLLVSMMMA